MVMEAAALASAAGELEPAQQEPAQAQAVVVESVGPPRVVVEPAQVMVEPPERYSINHNQGDSQNKSGDGFRFQTGLLLMEPVYPQTPAGAF